MLKRRPNTSPRPSPCALTRCMAVLKGAWAPNIIWHLRGGSRRFSELKADIPPISPKVLAARLRDLEQRGVVMRHVRATSPPSVDYELTALGARLIPALDAIHAVGELLGDQPAGCAANPGGA